MASINDLPLLALERIFLYAGGTNLFNWINVFPHVCCLWRDIMPHLWSKAWLLRYESYNSHCWFSVFLSREPNPLCLKVKDKGASIASTFEYITSRCRKVTKLTLVLDGVKDLSMLNSNGPAELQNLRDKFLKRSDSSQFMECFGSLANLQEIEAINLRRGEDLKLLANAMLCFPKNLRHVSFGIQCLASVEPLRFLSELHELETLKLKVERDYSSGLIDIFAMCSDKLRNVLLSCGVATVLNVEQCQNAMRQLAKKQIHSLHLDLWSTTMVRWVQIPGFDKIFCTVVEFNNLKELKLCWADFSRDEYAMVLQRLRLVKLEIEIATNLNDKFFNSFTVGMQMLEHLSISGFPSDSRQSSESLVEFLVKCQRLEKFFVSIGFLKGPVVNFCRLFHRKFHVCGKYSSKVNVDTALDITLADCYNDCIAFLTDSVKNENFCSLKILKIDPTVMGLRFFKHCQSN